MLVQSIPDSPSTVSILLTTDNHVGYAENDPIRSDDAWRTFEEICQIARDRGVDMMVQGGDLFHINKPSKKSMYHVMRALREHCMGDKPIELEMVSEPAAGLAGMGVNYEDANLNVSIPVFAICGNHDDATGDAFLSPLDLLAMSGLVNHFGKVTDNENITVSPLLFRKGSTSLALYGMGNIRDERLHRSFRDGQVKFQRPTTGNWFNMLVFHQNHAQHTFTSSIPESFLPSFLDLVFWGHEHECIPYPSHNPETGFEVLLGGSSIATSLSEGEVAQKCVYVMKILEQNYSIEAIPLKTVRPFVHKEIVLSEVLVPDVSPKNEVMEYLAEQIESMIDTNGDTLPLIRLKVEYTGFEIDNAQRFSNRFVSRVANPHDCIVFHKKKKSGQKTRFVDTDLFEAGESSKKSVEVQLNDIMAEFLKQAQLTLLPESGLNNAVNKFIQNGDKHVLDQYIKKEVKNEAAALMKIDIDSTASENHISHVLRGMRRTKDEEREGEETERETEKQEKSAKGSVKRKPRRATKSREYVESSDDLHDEVMGF